MLSIDIPGFGKLNVRHLVTDFTGTLSVDGVLLPGVEELLADVGRILNVHVLTADTFKKAQAALKGANDRLMLKAARIGIAVIEGEGCAVDAVLSADIVVKDIHDALNLLRAHKRLVATLRR